MSTSELITPTQYAEYQENGVLCLRGRFTDWVEILLRGGERNFAEPGPHAGFNSGADGTGMFFDDFLSWQRIPEFEDFVRRSPAAAIAGLCMGAANSRILMDHILIKREGVSLSTPWHHDITYMNVVGDLSATIWVALDQAPRGITPEFLIGSHRWNKLYRPRHFKDGQSAIYGEDYDEVPDIEALRDAPRAGWDVEPGDALIFHFKTLHGTSAQTVVRRRAAYATRWMGEDVRFAGMPDKLALPWNTLAAGDALPADACPVVWRRDAEGQK